MFCTLRISEVLGLQWRHIDFTRGLIQVRQRFYRGNVDTVKSERSARDVPMGEFATDLAAIYPGAGPTFSLYARIRNVRSALGSAAMTAVSTSIFCGRPPLSRGSTTWALAFTLSGARLSRSLQSMHARTKLNAYPNTHAQICACTTRRLTWKRRAMQFDGYNPLSVAARITQIQTPLLSRLTLSYWNHGGPVQTRTADLYRVKVAL